jgi:hypothetical protein
MTTYVHFWVPATTVSAGLRFAPQNCLEDAVTKAGRFCRRYARFPRNSEIVAVEDGQVRDVADRLEDAAPGM